MGHFSPRNALLFVILNAKQNGEGQQDLLPLTEPTCLLVTISFTMLPNNLLMACFTPLTRVNTKLSSLQFMFLSFLFFSLNWDKAFLNFQCSTVDILQSYLQVISVSLVVIYLSQKSRKQLCQPSIPCCLINCTVEIVHIPVKRNVFILWILGFFQR